jgi:S-DNA-T family DNA segregation ATPase FtsK/SpoIIIE
MPVRKSVPKRVALKRNERARHPQVAYDLAGIGFCALGLVCSVALARTNQAGIAGYWLAWVLRYAVGRGAWVFPGLTVALGLALILDRDRRPPTDIVAGCAVAGAAVLGMVHLVSFPAATPIPAAEQMGAAGGALGWLVGSAAYRLVGTPGGWVVLGALALAGVVLALNAPLGPILRRVGAAVANACTRPRRPKRETAKGRALVLRRNSEKANDANAGSDPEPKPAAPAWAVRRRQLAKQADPVSPPEPAKEPLQLDKPVETSIGPFQLPPLGILPQGDPGRDLTQEEREENVRILEATLANFNIEAKVVEISHGPTVTRYEIQLAPGIRVKKIESLADNIAMDLAAIYVRVEAPIPGKCAIGVEVPNRTPTTVLLRDVVDRPEFLQAASKLTVPLGMDVAGQPVYADLAKMPHLLIGGSTNSGKSVCLNSLIVGMLMRATPDELRLLLIDPKKVELSLYDGIPHLVYPVVKDVRQATGVLRWAEKEMHIRYDKLVETQTRNIDGYNKKVKDPHQRLPYILIVIDELADLMLRQGPEVETSITSLAQLARAVGIHLVIATQRPSVDVITGTIKANISSRIAFAVASHTDSRTILDKNGAERLVGKGDMLFLPIDAAKPIRVQGAYVGEAEIEALVRHLKAQGSPDFIADVVSPDSEAVRNDCETDDELFEQAVRLVVTSGHASTSMLQRKFKIGYTRAARLVDVMEQQGLVGPMDNAKPREILLSKEELDDYFRSRANGGLA